MKRVFLIVTSLLISFAVYRDLYNIKRKHAFVLASQWICHKTRPKAILRTIAWNATLYNLPDITIAPYLGVIPIENLFDWSDNIMIPHSKKALVLFDGEWPADLKDNMCVFVDPYPIHCNIFEMCIWWPFTLVLKPLLHIIDPFKNLKI